MPKLKCDVRNCIYNADLCCCKSVIKIVGEDAHSSQDTTCISFHRRKRPNIADIYKAEFGKLDGINQYVSIECDARNCIYNVKELCTADKVKIAGGVKAQKATQTICNTFVERI